VVLISEVFLGMTDQIELYNAGAEEAILDGWYVEWYGVDRDGTESVSGTLNIASYTLEAGGYLVLSDAGFTGTTEQAVENEITFDDNIRLGVGDPGTVILYNTSDDPLDFFQFNGDDTAVPTGIEWTGTIVSEIATGFSRVPESEDNDEAGDFCFTDNTRGTENAECPID
jgi:hypothetical protein